MPSLLEGEIKRVVALTRKMLDSYTEWGTHVVVGEVSNLLYDEMAEFVNLRMETAESCLLLIENDKVGDALGLSRSPCF